MAENSTALYHDRQPLRLLRNVTYPTYQLHAVAGRGKAPPSAVLTRCILHTLAWLRLRFRDIDVPADLQAPEPDAAAAIDPESIHSFRIDQGYKVEAVWVPEEQIWTMQLTEPDLGPDPGSANPKRPPVPGRLFETNIAYRAAVDEVECGFRTIVSDIEGTTVPCEVYRLAVIKRLARDPEVGLKQGWPLQGEPHRLETVALIQQLQNWLKDKARTMPAVIAAECSPELPLPPDPQIMDHIRDALQGGHHPASLTKTPLPPELLPLLPRLAQPPLAKPPLTQSPQSLPLQVWPSMAARPVEPFPDFIADMAHFQMGYAQFFHLPAAQLPAFRKHTGRQINAGEILILEPVAFGGETIRFSQQQLSTQADGTRNEIERLVQNYPLRKPMAFGRVAFLAEAKVMERRKAMAHLQSKAKLLEASDERIQAADARHREALRAWEEGSALLRDKIRRLEEQISGLDAEKALLRQHEGELKAAHEADLAERDGEIAHLRTLLDRPASLDGIVDWVRTRLHDGLVFLPRAAREIEAADPSEVKLPLLCDALAYLATDYREQLLGRIGADECLRRCARKYNRNFEIALQRGTSIEMYPAEYKVKYGTGATGKPRERLLDLHLKVGDHGPWILRIYFFFDKEIGKIVVGSLPRHLPVVSFNS